MFEYSFDRLEVVQLPAFQDNYLYLLSADGRKSWTVIDPGDPKVIADGLKKLGGSLTKILLTHHHLDHIGGALKLKQDYGAEVYGPTNCKTVCGVGIEATDKDATQLQDPSIQVLDVRGHTACHVAYYFSDSGCIFVGDSLFAMGCGRLFTGTMQNLHGSVQKILALPEETKVFCAHEYTQKNISFAESLGDLTKSQLERKFKVADLRSQQKPSVPFTIAEEKATSPFYTDSYTEFARLRELRDQF